MVTAKPLLDRAEQVLYARLVRAFPGHIVLAQVALAQLLEVDQAAATSGAKAANRFRPNQLSRWVADFVVCRPDFTALAVIELDTAVPRNQQRDASDVKDQLLQVAGIKVVRVAANDIPQEAALKVLVATLPLNRSTPRLIRHAS